MRQLIFAILGLVMLAGCGRQTPPDVDTLRSQLLRQACEALRTGDVKQARDALKRLQDATGSDSFTEYATEWLEHRQTITALNDALRNGDVQKAKHILDAATGGAYRATTAARPKLRALTAFEAYLAKRPFGTARQARQALDDLAPHLDALQTSADFRAFLEDEKARIEALRHAEKQAVIQALVEQLDLAAVTGETPARPLLDQLAAEAPDHALLKALKAALDNDSTAVAGLATAMQRSPDLQRALEVALCLAWHDMPAASWDAVVPILAASQPLSVSGMLMKAVADADTGNWTDAVEGLKTLAQAAPLSRRHVARLMQTYLLPPRHFRAWCWQLPCPGIPELLSRIAQIRTYGRIDGEGL